MTISKEQAYSWVEDRLDLVDTRFGIEKSIKIPFLWKTKIWNPYLDVIEYRRTSIFIAWKRMPCKFGYKIRIGII